MKQEFIDRIAGYCQHYALAYGHNIVSVSIAQAILESGFGTSELSSKYNNHFGLKAGGSWTGMSVNLYTHEEYFPGEVSTITDFFRVYETFEQGVKGYWQFINWSRYANLKEAQSPYEYAERIKLDGYATDSKYVDKLINIVSKYNLTKYDDFFPFPTRTLKYKVINRVTGNDVKFLQKFLGITIDGKFGPATEAAVKHFQGAWGLEIDGSCGPKTLSKIKEIYLHDGGIIR